MPGFGNFARSTEDKIRQAFTERVFGEFGNMVGSTNPYYRGTGSLIEAGQDVYDEFVSLRNADRLVYVVWSYDTPIAWVLDNGNGCKVQHRFSQTTTGHQRMCSLYL